MKLIRIIIFLAICVSALFFYRQWIASRVELPQPDVTWTNENSLTTSSEWPAELDDLDVVSLRTALQQSLVYFGRRDPNEAYSFGGVRIPQAVMITSFNSLLAFLNTAPTAEQLYEYIKTNFSLHRSAAPQVLFTGYYIPHLLGSMVPTDRFKYPLYATPSDLLEIALSPDLKAKLPKDFPVMNRGRLEGKRVIVPYYSRAEIDTNGKLNGKNLEILWVDSLLDLFFLHIQGSGTVELPDGSTVRVGYAEKNGQPYRAIGKTLLEKGILEKGKITMFTIKDALKNNAALVDEVLNSNPSYVFFRVLDGDPVGSLNVPVIAGRSIATDQSLFPKGALGIITTEKPFFKDDGSIQEWKQFTRMVLNHDTGGAIRGPGRVDIFLGDSKEAENIAAITQQKGSLWFLAPRIPEPR